MIDDPRKTELLMAMLKESVPIPATLTPELVQVLAKQDPDIAIPTQCNVIDVIYMGEEGGITCCLDIGGRDTKAAHLVSLTHLRFHRHVVLAREIEAYQRHRVKKLNKQRGRGY